MRVMNRRRLPSVSCRGGMADSASLGLTLDVWVFVGGSTPSSRSTARRLPRRKLPTISVTTLRWSRKVWVWPWTKPGKTPSWLGRPCKGLLGRQGPTHGCETARPADLREDGGWREGKPEKATTLLLLWYLLQHPITCPMLYRPNVIIPARLGK